MEEARRQRQNQQELDQKLKRDRLQAIRTRLTPAKDAAYEQKAHEEAKGLQNWINAGHPAAATSSVPPPTLPTDPTGHLPQPPSFDPTVGIQCPTHKLNLVQVRDKTTGRDKFYCPQFLQCKYVQDPIEQTYKSNAINPDSEERSERNGHVLLWVLDQTVHYSETGTKL